MYLMLANDSLMIEYKISNLLEQHKIVDFNKFVFYYAELNELKSALLQSSLFELKTDVYVLNLSIKELNKNKVDLQQLFIDLKNISDDKYLFIVIDDLKFNYKDFKKYFSDVLVMESINTKNKKETILNVLKSKNLDLNNHQIDTLVNRLPKNIQIIKNEINKLNSDNLNQINQIICDYNEFEIFEIVSYLLKKDYYKLFELFNKIVLDRDKINYLFNYLATKTLNLYLIKKAYSYNLKADEIAKLFNLNIYAVLNDIKLIEKITIQDIEELLYNLRYIEKINRLYDIDLLILFKLLFFKIRISNNNE